MVVAEGTWCHCEACVEVKRSREGDVFVRGSSKNLEGFTPEGYLSWRRTCSTGGRRAAAALERSEQAGEWAERSPPGGIGRQLAAQSHAGYSGCP